MQAVDLFSKEWILKTLTELFGTKDGIETNTWHDEWQKEFPLSRIL